MEPTITESLEAGETERATLYYREPSMAMDQAQAQAATHPQASLYVGDLSTEVRSLADLPDPAGDRGDAVREVLRGGSRALHQGVQGHDHQVGLGLSRGAHHRGGERK